MLTSYMKTYGAIVQASDKVVDGEVEGAEFAMGEVKIDLTKDQPAGQLTRAGHTLTVLVNLDERTGLAAGTTLMAPQGVPVSRLLPHELYDSYVLAPQGVSRDNGWEPGPAGAKMYGMIEGGLEPQPCRIKLTRDFITLLKKHPEVQFIHDGKVEVPKRVFAALVTDHPGLAGKYDARSGALDVEPAELGRMLLAHPELTYVNTMYGQAWDLQKTSQAALELGLIKDGEVIGGGIMSMGPSFLHVMKSQRDAAKSE